MVNARYCNVVRYCSVNALLVNMVQDLQKVSQQVFAYVRRQCHFSFLHMYTTPLQLHTCIYTHGCHDLIGWLSDTETAATPINTYLTLACNPNTALLPWLRYLTICSAAKLSLTSNPSSLLRICQPRTQSVRLGLEFCNNLIRNEYQSKSRDVCL